MNASRGVLYIALIASSLGCSGKGYDIYIHRRGAFALLVSTNWGNAKAFTSWNGQQESAPRFFGYVHILITNLSAVGAFADDYYLKKL